MSRWLKLDLVARRAALGLPVTHVEAEQAKAAGVGSRRRRASVTAARQARCAPYRLRAVKLATFQAPGRAEPAGRARSTTTTWSRSPTASVVDVLAARRRAERAATRWPLAEVQLLAPVPRPGTIYAIGLNYANTSPRPARAARAPDRVRQGPRLGGAARRPDPLPGGRAPARLRGRADDRDRRRRRIGGYCVADDVSARDLQGREPQWTRAKGADTFCPFGPWITTADEVPDPDDLRLRTWVNDELRQDSRTSDLIFGCQELVDFIAQTCTLASR